MTGTLVTEAPGATVTITDVTDPWDDTTLDDVITGVSREIDDVSGRQFYQVGTGQTPSIRYYTPMDSVAVYIDDLVSIAELATDDNADRTYSTVWATTDYEIAPRNAGSKGKPYTSIQATPNGAYRFWYPGRDSVRVKGIFGWSAIPAQVKQACLIQAARIFKRGDAPFGVLGSAEMGQLMVLPKLDPDVVLMLAGVKRQLV